jgi:ESF2/ABP1 family protein
VPVTVTVTLMAAAAAAARLRPGPSRAHWRPLSASASVPPARDSMTTAKTGIVHTTCPNLGAGRSARASNSMASNSSSNAASPEPEENEVHSTAEDSGAKKKVKGPLTVSKVLKFKQEKDRTGVVYISRVPPYMKPEKVRHLLSKHGEILRIFLSPEDPAIRKKRKMMGGNKRQSYVDGWVEFADKKVARQVVSMLNTRPIGGKKASFYSSDLWSLKYLSKFKWHHLTEKIAHDNAVRKHKLQTEVSQAKRERDFFLDKVEQSKKLKRKASSAPPDASGDGGGDADAQVKRVFRQVAPLQSTTPAEQTDVPNKGLLSKIFGGKPKA